MSHFYVHYFLCDMGVTQVNDLRAILPINPCQVLLHTNSIPLQRWLTLWLHEVMRATWLSILHVCKKSSSVETTGGAECFLRAWWRGLIKTQVSISNMALHVLYSCVSPRGRPTWAGYTVYCSVLITLHTWCDHQWCVQDHGQSHITHRWVWHWIELWIFTVITYFDVWANMKPL